MICPEYIEDGEFCLRCQYHATDHLENAWTICPFCRDDQKSCNACDDSYTEVS